MEIGNERTQTEMMTMAWLLIFLAWIPTCYLLLLGWAARRCPHSLPQDKLCFTSYPVTRFRVLIPAHNEARHIVATVTAARSLDYPADKLAIIVVANACTDDTAELARSAGAQVFEYAPPGKGGALHYAMNRLMDDLDWDALLVLDADSILDPWALAACDRLLQEGAEALQLRYAVRNALVTPRACLAAVQLASVDGIRPLGRNVLGWSAGIFGNGFVLTRRVIAEVPYQAFGIVEDIEYHQILQLSGKRVVFTDAAAVWAEMPETHRQLATQRARWIRGRFWTIRRYLIKVLRHTSVHPWLSLGQLTELCMPPISWVVLGFAGGFAVGDQGARTAALIGLAAILFHYWYAAGRYRLTYIFWKALRYAPFYIIEKLWVVLHSAITERNLGWKRTERE